MSSPTKVAIESQRGQREKSQIAKQRGKDQNRQIIGIEVLLYFLQ